MSDQIQLHLSNTELMWLKKNFSPVKNPKGFYLVYKNQVPNIAALITHGGIQKKGDKTESFKITTNTILALSDLFFLRPSPKSIFINPNSILHIINRSLFLKKLEQQNTASEFFLQFIAKK